LTWNLASLMHAEILGSIVIKITFYDDSFSVRVVSLWTSICLWSLLIVVYERKITFFFLAFVFVVEPTFQTMFCLKKASNWCFLGVFQWFWYVDLKKKPSFWCIFNWEAHCTALPNTLNVVSISLSFSLFLFVYT
jgi:hypothetical protein